MINLSFCNLCARMNNGIISKKSIVFVSYTNLNYLFLKVLLEKGLIESFFINEIGLEIGVCLKYFNSAPAINKIQSLSKPSKKRYIKLNKLRKMYGIQLVFLSTSVGILTKNEALFFRKGGIGLCIIC